MLQLRAAIACQSRQLSAPMSLLSHIRGVSTSKGEQGNAAENSLREKLESGFITEFVSVKDVSGDC